MFLLIFPKPAQASIDLTISDLSPKDDYYQLTAKVTGMSSSSATYIQAMFSLDGQNKYFGFTFGKNGDWLKYDGSPDKQYVLDNFIKLENDQLTTVFLKPDYTDTDYQGPGQYTVKLKRYTASGSSSDYSNSLSLSLAQTTPTPTPSATSTPTSTPTQAPATKTPTPTAVKTPTPTQRVVVTNTVSPTQALLEVNEEPQVLATSTSKIYSDQGGDGFTSPSSTNIASPESETKRVSDKNLFLIGALIFSVSGSVLYFRLKNL